MAETEAVENTNKIQSLLQKCPADNLAGFIHRVIDCMSDQRSLGHEEFAEVWTDEEWPEVLKAAQALILDSVKESRKEDVESVVEGLPKAHQAVFSECVESRQPDLLSILLSEACTLESSYLRDFDWKLKLVLASDKMSTIREPLLELDLALQEGKEKRIVSLEMSKDELKKLITSLEAAHKTVLQLTM